MEHVLSAARYAQISIDEEQWAQFRRYLEWLEDEAIPAGGLGGQERDRLERRHIADSVLFASALPAKPDEIWDLGSGVGLPGIPLAIALPGTRFVLIDRSRRRGDLLRRVIRILDLTNCVVIETDIGALTGSTSVLVSRASLPPDRLGEVAKTHLNRGGTAIVGGSWQSPPRHQDWDTVEIPAEVLDQPIWLLIMRRT